MKDVVNAIVWSLAGWTVVIVLMYIAYGLISLLHAVCK